MANDQRTKLLERKARIDARLKALDLIAKKQERRDDTRRKIIAGALVLEHATIRDEFAQQLTALLNRYVKRPEDRALFEFLDDRLPDTAATEESPALTATLEASAAETESTDPDQEPQRESA